MTGQRFRAKDYTSFRETSRFFRRSLSAENTVSRNQREIYFEPQGGLFQPQITQIKKIFHLRPIIIHALRA